MCESGSEGYEDSNVDSRRDRGMRCFETLLCTSGDGSVEFRVVDWKFWGGSRQFGDLGFFELAFGSGFLSRRVALFFGSIGH